jgi:hypothetical protein
LRLLRLGQRWQKARMNRKPLVMAALALTAGLLWWSVISQPRDAEPRSRQPSNDTRPSAQLMDAAPREQEVPRQPVVAAEPAKQVALSSPQQPAEAPAEPHAETTEVEPPMDRQNMKPPVLRGPVTELKHRFNNESRSSASGQLESQVKALFADPNVPPELLDSVLCRRTVCKINLRWTADRMVGYVYVSGYLRRDFDPQIGVSPALENDASGARPIELYLKTRDSAPGL